MNESSGPCLEKVIRYAEQLGMMTATSQVPLRSLAGAWEVSQTRVFWEILLEFPILTTAQQEAE